jgi:hypothetical protein
MAIRADCGRFEVLQFSLGLVVAAAKLRLRPQANTIGWLTTFRFSLVFLSRGPRRAALLIATTINFFVAAVHVSGTLQFPGGAMVAGLGPAITLWLANGLLGKFDPFFLVADSRLVPERKKQENRTRRMENWQRFDSWAAPRHAVEQLWVKHRRGCDRTGYCQCEIRLGIIPGAHIVSVGMMMILSLTIN